MVEAGESRKRDSAERWNGASSAGVGAMYDASTRPMPVTEIATLTSDVGLTFERYWTTYSRASRAPSAS